eukprot:SAG31_NODE_451_length_15511_cov_77.547301_12_plen_89_part_00
MLNDSDKLQISHVPVGRYARVNFKGKSTVTHTVVQFHSQYLGRSICLGMMQAIEVGLEDPPITRGTHAKNFKNKKESSLAMVPVNAFR